MLNINFFQIEHGVSDEDVIRGCREQKLKDAVYSLGSIANQHIEHVSSRNITYSKTNLFHLLAIIWLFFILTNGEDYK